MTFFGNYSSQLEWQVQPKIPIINKYRFEIQLEFEIFMLLLISRILPDGILVVEECQVLIGYNCEIAVVKEGSRSVINGS